MIHPNEYSYPRAVGAIEAQVRWMQTSYRFAESEGRKDEVVNTFLAQFEETIQRLDGATRMQISGAEA